MAALFDRHRRGGVDRALTTHAARTYGDRYRAITEVVMGRINALLDPEYQFAPDAAPDGVRGVARFL